MAIRLYGTRLVRGRGCGCGAQCMFNRRPRSKASVERTTSYRHRAGSKRTKKLARQNQLSIPVKF